VDDVCLPAGRGHHIVYAVLRSRVAYEDIPTAACPSASQATVAAYWFSALHRYLIRLQCSHRPGSPKFTTLSKPSRPPSTMEVPRGIPDRERAQRQNHVRDERAHAAIGHGRCGGANATTQVGLRRADPVVTKRSRNTQTHFRGWCATKFNSACGPMDDVCLPARRGHHIVYSVPRSRVAYVDIPTATYVYFRKSSDGRGRLVLQHPASVINPALMILCQCSTAASSLRSPSPRGRRQRWKFPPTKACGGSDTPADCASRSAFGSA
jgi:hypothetical protein